MILGMFLSIPEGVSVATVIIDGVDVAPADLSETNAWYSGAGGRALGHYDPMRLKWLNNPSGKPQTPCDLGLCKIFPEAKTAAKAWAQFASHRRTTRPAFLRRLRSRNPSLLACPGNGITVFTPGGAMAMG